MMAILCMVGALNFTAAAQQATTKPNVYIDYFWRPVDVDFNFTEMVRNNVMEYIISTGRVELIDVDSQSALALEKDRRMNMNLSDGDDLDRIAVMKQEGANALIQGRINSFSIARKTNDKGKVSYVPNLVYTIKVINPNDGKLLGTRTIKMEGDFLGLNSYGSAEEAATGVAKTGQKDIRRLIEESFPVEATILELAEVKGPEIKTMYISVGSDAGVAKDHKFAICVERKIAGRVSQTTIGECVVKAVEGGDISLAEVKKGKRELKDALDNGQTVVLKSVAR